MTVSEFIERLEAARLTFSGAERELTFWYGDQKLTILGINTGAGVAGGEMDIVLQFETKGYPQKTLGDLFQEIEQLQSQKAALLAACKKMLKFWGDLQDPEDVDNFMARMSKHEKEFQSVIKAGESGE